jgi:hypothetical protein
MAKKRSRTDKQGAFILSKGGRSLRLPVMLTFQVGMDDTEISFIRRAAERGVKHAVAVKMLMKSGAAAYTAAEVVTEAQAVAVVEIETDDMGSEL